MANNIHFLLGSPSTDLSTKESQNGTFYLTSNVENNQNSNRLYVGTSDAVGGIKPIVTPTPYYLNLNMNGVNELVEYTGSENETVNLIINNDGVYQNGSQHAAVHFAICNTPAGTAAKATSLTGYHLIPGSRVHLKFLYTNTAENPTLNINGTGAKPIDFNNKLPYLLAGNIYTFIYDDVNYVLLDEYHRVDQIGGEGAEVHNHFENIALGAYSFAEGAITKANGDYSHAEGAETSAYGIGAHAEGGRYYYDDMPEEPEEDSGEDPGAPVSLRNITNLNENEKTLQIIEPWEAETLNGEIYQIIGSTAIGLSSHVEGMQTVSEGDGSHAEGRETYAAGQASHTEGYYTYTSGDGSHAEGYSTGASGYYSHAEGVNTEAQGFSSHAEGLTSVAKGEAAHAEGFWTLSSGYASHAEGQETYSDGDGSHAEGIQTAADQPAAHAEGIRTLARGIAAHAEGIDSWSFGNSAHAEGYYTFAHGNGSHTEGGNLDEDGETELEKLEFRIEIPTGGTWNYEINGSYSEGVQSHAEGTQTLAHGYSSHAEGYQTRAVGKIAHAEGLGTESYGIASHSEGQGTQALHNSAHAEGYFTTAEGEGSHTEGRETYSIGDYSHAEGGNINLENTGTLEARDIVVNNQSILVNGSTANGIQSHAEGTQTLAYGHSSHSEGHQTNAIGLASHAEGNSTQAQGECSHAEGLNTTALGATAHAEGNYAIAEGMASHAEGGNIGIDGNTLPTQTITYGDQTIDINGPVAYGIQSHAEGTQTLAYGYSSHAEGGLGPDIYNTIEENLLDIMTDNFGSFGIPIVGENFDVLEVYTGTAPAAVGIQSHAEGSQTLAYGDSSHAEGMFTSSQGRGSHSEGFIALSIGDYSHSEGMMTTAIGMAAHTEGFSTSAEGIYSHAEGLETQAKGFYSHAEGGRSTTSGDYSHAEGLNTIAYGTASHAEGENNSAKGYASHVEGSENLAEGITSHAEGYITSAVGNYSHSQNLGTIANGVAQTVLGKYNVADTSSALIIGNGTADNARSNILTLDWSGNAVLAGTLTAPRLIGTADNSLLAESALKDGNGNVIVDTYVTLNTQQVISGNKTFAGNIVLTQDVNYGDSLPTSAVEGQIFFTPLGGGEVAKTSGLVIYRITEV